MEFTCLFVIENNRYAQSTPFELQIAGKIKNRPEAFGIRTTELNTTDVVEISNAAEKLFQESEIIASHNACF